MTIDPHLDSSIFGEPPPPDTRRQRRLQQRRGPRRRGRRWAVIALALAVVAGGTALAVPAVRSLVGLVGGSEDGDFAGPGSGTVTVVVKPGDTGESIATELKKLGVVKTRTAYLDAAQADPQSAAKIQSGSYTLKKGMKGADAFTWMTDPSHRSSSGAVTIPEGLWASEIYARLSKATGVPVADYEKAAKNADALALPASARGNVEGYLFPATYEFTKDDSATAQLSAMVAKTVAELDRLDVPESRREHVVTVASIIEGEARMAQDRGKVARVIENRVADPTGPTVGLLQMDSTRNYALKKRGALTMSDIRRADRSDYSTYAHKGLPPGPIANPGKAAIDAAANPTSGPWFYFVTVNLDTGETIFATTLAEQEANNAKLRAWCDRSEANKAKCYGR